MPTLIQKGARVDITTGQAKVSKVTVEIGWETTGPIDIDSSLFMLDANGKCLNDESMIFYGNSTSADQSVSHIVLNHPTKKIEQFHIELQKVSSITEKLVLTLTIYEGDKNGQTFSQMKNAYVRILNDQQQEMIHYQLDPFTIENSLVIAELYRRNGNWKLSTNTGGFAEGLAALCNHFGLEIKEDAQASTPIQQSQPAPQPPLVPQPVPVAAPIVTKKAAEPPRQQAPINLGIVTLKKPGDFISLRKTAKIKNIHVRLNWTKAVDLDIHAFYITKQGKFGHIFFGNKGKINHSPYISLDKDAGVGNSAGNNEENLMIGTLEDIDKVIIATNIFRFLGFRKKDDNFAKYDGRVLIKTNNGDDIEVPLTSTTPGRWCIIAKIDNTNTTDPKVININHVQATEPTVGDI